ncbi:hypothetical protein DFP74_6121 [Nocardiopsis sp. Huas11]|uniref:hypothetical protein n=1 Tax=Nocardiopsis sp. Huas11 TaxID=2183912 RepID=UPI000EAF0DED|nr:hypothetical protein [Nocardiopsis sp. Huas11]RKS10358.1 hypothetical protein DFP74_6121 [Nocardiopsis sp. Huas11]
MTITPRPQTIDSIARAVVTQCAPDEKAHYPHLRDDFFDRGSRTPDADHPLGFGAVAVGVVTGIVLSVLHELAVGSLTEAARPWWDRSWAWILTRLGMRKAPETGPGTVLAAIPADRIDAVTKAIVAHAVRADIPEEKASLIAEAVIRELDEPGGPIDGTTGSGEH